MGAKRGNVPTVGDSPAATPDLLRFSCPNPDCVHFQKFGQGNLRVGEQMGKDKRLLRWVCRACQPRFSELRGSLLEYSKLPEEKVVRIVKCLTWGNSVEATADIGEVDPRTVQRIVERGGGNEPDASTPRRSGTSKPPKCRSTRCTGAGGKKKARAAVWVFTALAVSSRLLLGVSVGDRNAEHADRFVAQIALYLTSLPLFQVDPWKAYSGAFLRIAYRVVHRRRRSRSQRGRRPGAVLAPRKDLYVAVVDKIREVSGPGGKVGRFALYGTLKAARKILAESGVGQVIHTSFRERLHATMRGQTARLARRTRAGSVLRRLLESQVEGNPRMPCGPS
jgi:transposase-like protein